MKKRENNENNLQQTAGDIELKKQLHRVRPLGNHCGLFDTSEGQPTAGRKNQTGVRESIPEKPDSFWAGAMEGNDLPNAVSVKGFDGFFDSVWGGIQQMHASEEGMDGPAGCKAADIIENIHQAGMGTPDDDDKPPV